MSRRLDEVKILGALRARALCATFRSQGGGRGRIERAARDYASTQRCYRDGAAMEKALMAMGPSSWTQEIAFRRRRSARARGKILRPAFWMERGWARAAIHVRKEADSGIWPDGQ